MTHNVLIAVHALAGVISFGAGVLSVPLTTTRSWRFRTYLWSLAAMTAFAAAAVAWEWAALDTGTRLVYAGLIGLAAFMVVRALSAAARLHRRDRDWRGRYIDGVGFTLISLFDGFGIVAAIDLGAPVWLVLLIAVGGVVVGILAKNRAKHRIAAVPAAPTMASSG